MQYVKDRLATQILASVTPSQCSEQALNAVKGLYLARRRFFGLWPQNDTALVLCQVKEAQGVLVQPFFFDGVFEGQRQHFLDDLADRQAQVARAGGKDDLVLQ